MNNRVLRVIFYTLLAITALIMILLPLTLVFAKDKKPSDPLNVPLESLGVTGYDRTLCSDRWGSCSRYDREQFDTKYPGQPLEELSRYALDEEAPRGGAGQRTGRDYEERSRASEE